MFLLVLGFFIGCLLATVMTLTDPRANTQLPLFVSLAFFGGFLLCLTSVLIFAKLCISGEKKEEDERWWLRGEPPPWER